MILQHCMHAAAVVARASFVCMLVKAAICFCPSGRLTKHSLGTLVVLALICMMSIALRLERFPLNLNLQLGFLWRVFLPSSPTIS